MIGPSSSTPWHQERHPPESRQHVGARWSAHKKILTLGVAGTPLLRSGAAGGRTA
jgi:hypothetical protein